MLILVAHGSRDPEWRASVEAVVRSLEDELGPDRVRLAYMDLTPPTLMDVAGAAAEAGARKVSVLPLFLASQGHVERDVRPMTDEVRVALRNLDVELLPPLGQHAEYRDALARIARRTQGTLGAEFGSGTR